MRHVPRSLKLTAAILALGIALGGCAGSGSDASEDAGGGEDAAKDLPPVPDEEFSDETGASEVEIDARDNTFQGQYVTVSPGTRVTFDNVGRNDHNVIPVVEDEFEAIDTDELQPDDSATIVLSEPGIYPYYCSLHGTKTAGMVGRIRVAAE